MNIKRYRHLALSVMLLLPAIAILSCLPEAAAAEYSITYGPARTLTVRMERQGAWIAIERESLFGVTLKGNKEVEFYLDEKKVGTGTFKGEKLKTSWQAHPLFTEVKFHPEKIKVHVREGEVPWEIKYKKDKIEVVRDGKEYGKVKFYPESGKLKAKARAKDQSESEVAVLRKADGLTGALAPFLMEGLDEAARNLLVTLLFALNR